MSLGVCGRGVPPPCAAAPEGGDTPPNTEFPKCCCSARGVPVPGPKSLLLLRRGGGPQHIICPLSVWILKGSGCCCNGGGTPPQLDCQLLLRQGYPPHDQKGNCCCGVHGTPLVNSFAKEKAHPGTYARMHAGMHAGAMSVTLVVTIHVFSQRRS